VTPAQRQIIEDVAKRHGLTVGQILSRSQARRIARPRQEAMALLREAGRWSWPQIGAVFGLHHTTAIEGVRAHYARAEVDLRRWQALGERRAA
jgi:chromosomal replication initiator protein